MPRPMRGRPPVDAEGSRILTHTWGPRLQVEFTSGGVGSSEDSRSLADDDTFTPALTFIVGIKIAR